MSRHKNLKHIIDESYYDEDDYNEDEDYYQEEEKPRKHRTTKRTDRSLSQSKLHSSRRHQATEEEQRYILHKLQSYLHILD